VVFVNIMRCGPGLGGILPAQADYFQATKGGGHGDYRCLVLAPESVQEAVDLTMLAFERADRWRNPVFVLGDGLIGQMMEPVSFDRDDVGAPPEKPWATTGCQGRKPNLVKTLFLDPAAGERHNRVLAEKYRRMAAEEVRFDTYNMESDPSVVLVAYGTVGRICKSAIDELKAEGIEVGLVRPISLWPFPDEVLRAVAAADSTQELLVVEMSLGQMLEDVQRATRYAKPIHFYGRQGGIVPAPEEVTAKLREIVAARATPGASARGAAGAVGGGGERATA
jgi:2-oxoglutarate ferredoxin oxidoreductase subunit alpha